jgi:uncharacterized protein
MAKWNLPWNRIFKIALLIYGITGILLYYAQDWVLFKPTAVRKQQRYPFETPYTELNLSYDKGSNLNLIQFKSSDSIPTGVVLYFHGNRHNISWYARHVPFFRDRNLEVWMIDYPGYGKSTGTMTEQKFYDYATVVYDLAAKKFPKDSIILYGRSLGSGIASELASRKSCNKLILETPYYSIPSLVGFYFFMYPTGRMIHFQFPTYKYIQTVNAPVVIFHGTHDGVIPYLHASKLKKVLAPKDQFITIPGGSHNDLETFPLFQKKLDSLLRL